MAQNSKIEWTDHTFNPWRGCLKVSDGCKFCYAETLSKRNPKVLGEWGPKGTRVIAAESYRRQPLKWNAEAERSGIRRRVFCSSLADVFEDNPQVVEARRRLFDLIFRTQHLDWLLLTKRPENIIPMLRAIPVLKRDNVFDHLWSKYFQHVWLGTSVEDQQQADKRIPELLKVPAKIRFLSCEPLLGPLDIRWALHYPACPQHPGEIRAGWGHLPCDCRPYQRENKTGLEWVIAGGESGRNARPMHNRWARSLRDQCRDAGIAFHFKQHGEWIGMADYDPYELGFAFEKQYEHRMLWATYEGDPNDLPVSHFRVGKARAGRLLDDVEHNAIPEVW